MVLQKKYNSNKNQTLISPAVPTIFFKNKSVLNFKQTSHARNTSNSNPLLSKLSNDNISLYGEKLSNRMNQTAVSNAYFEQQKLQTAKVLQRLNAMSSQENEKALNLKRPSLYKELSQITDIGKKRTNDVLLIPNKTSEIVDCKRPKKSSPNKHDIRMKDKEFTLRDESFLGNPFLFEVSKENVKYIEKQKINNVSTCNVREVQLKNANNVVNCSIAVNKQIKTITPMSCLPHPIMYKTRSISQLISDIDDRRLCSYNNGSGILSSRTMDQRFENIKRLLDFDIPGSCISSNSISQTENYSIKQFHTSTQSLNGFCAGLNTSSTTLISISDTQTQRHMPVLHTSELHNDQEPIVSNVSAEYSPKKGSSDMTLNIKPDKTIFSRINESRTTKPSLESGSPTYARSKAEISPANDMYNKIELKSSSAGNHISTVLNLEDTKSVAQSQNNVNNQFNDYTSLIPATNQGQYIKKTIPSNEKTYIQPPYDSSNLFNSNYNEISSGLFGKNSNLSSTSLTVSSDNIEVVPSLVTFEKDVKASIPSDILATKCCPAGLFSSSSNKTGESIFSNKYQCDTVTSSLCNSNSTHNSGMIFGQNAFLKHNSIDEVKNGLSLDKFASPSISNIKNDHVPKSIFDESSNTKFLPTSNTILSPISLQLEENKLTSQVDHKKGIFNSIDLQTITPKTSISSLKPNIESHIASSNEKIEGNIAETTNAFTFGKDVTKIQPLNTFGKSENIKSTISADGLFGSRSSKNEISIFAKPKDVDITSFNQNANSINLSNDSHPPSYTSIFGQYSTVTSAPSTSNITTSDLRQKESSNIFEFGQKKDDLNNIPSTNSCSSAKTIFSQINSNLFSSKTQVETTSNDSITNVASSTNVFGPKSNIERDPVPVNQRKNENIFKSDDCKVKERSIFNNPSKETGSSIFVKNANVEHDSKKSENLFKFDNTEEKGIKFNIFDKQSKDESSNIGIFGKKSNTENFNREKENPVSVPNSSINIFGPKSNVDQNLAAASQSNNENIFQEKDVIEKKTLTNTFDKNTKAKSIFGQKSAIELDSMGQKLVQEKVASFNIFGKHSIDAASNIGIFGQKSDTAQDLVSGSNMKNEHIFKMDNIAEKPSQIGIFDRNSKNSCTIAKAEDKLKASTNFIFGQHANNGVSSSENIFGAKLSTVDKSITPDFAQCKSGAVFDQNSARNGPFADGPSTNISFKFDSKSENSNTGSEFKFGQSSQSAAPHNFGKKDSSSSYELKTPGQSRQTPNTVFSANATEKDSPFTLNNTKNLRERVILKRKP